MLALPLQCQIKSLVSRLQGYETTSSEVCMGCFWRVQEITGVRGLKNRAILKLIKQKLFLRFQRSSQFPGLTVSFKCQWKPGTLLRDSAVMGHSREVFLHLSRSLTDTSSGVFSCCRHYLVVFPAALQYPSTQVACLHITCHEAKVQVNLALERSAGRELLMQETIQKKKTFLCTKFWVSHPRQMPSLIFLSGNCLCYSLTRGVMDRIYFALV